MSNTTKSPHHVVALNRARDLGEEAQTAHASLEATRAHLDDLQSRNQSGDLSVSGLDLVTARAEIEAAEGLAAHAALVLADARSEAADALARYTAQEVRKSITVDDLSKTRQSAARAIEAALGSIDEALRQRDADSDAAGQALADAGVPAGKWINGIRYVPVGSLSGTGPAIPGRFNVEVEAADGRTVWLSSTGSARNRRREYDRMSNDVLNDALRPTGRRLTPRAISRTAS